MGGSAQAAIIQALLARQGNPNLQFLSNYLNSKRVAPQKAPPPNPPPEGGIRD